MGVRVLNREEDEEGAPIMAAMAYSLFFECDCEFLETNI